MLALYSLWTDPQLKGNQRRFFGFSSPLEYFCSCVISVNLAKQHLKKTKLVTDSWGYEHLCEQLLLPFDKAFITLNHLDAPLNLWAIGKLYAQLSIFEPYSHIDTDLYLWKGLPEKLLTADIHVQCNEAPLFNREYKTTIRQYQKEGGVNKLLTEHDFSTPIYNTGIIGGNDLSSLHNYCADVINLAKDPAWRNCSGFSMMVLEQMYLGMYLQRLSMKPQSLISSPMVTKKELDAVRFTHLYGGAKNKLSIRKRILKRTQTDYPDYFERAVKLSETLDKNLTKTVISTLVDNKKGK